MNDLYDFVIVTITNDIKKLIQYTYAKCENEIVDEIPSDLINEHKLIDYKILRILKYLEMNINVEDIPNFKIEYNLEGINYYDSKGNKTVEDNLSKEEVEKIKKLVDKKTI